MVSDSVLVRSPEPETEKDDKTGENQPFATVPLNNSPVKKRYPCFFFSFKSLKSKTFLKQTIKALEI